MVLSTERKVRINPDIDPAIRQNVNDPITPNIHVTQTGVPLRRSGSSAGGYLIAAIIVLLGFALAIYFGSRSDTTAPSITQTQTAPEATPPATPPVATTEPAQPAQPDTTTQQPAAGTGTGTTTEQ